MVWKSEEGKLIFKALIIVFCIGMTTGALIGLLYLTFK